MKQLVSLAAAVAVSGVAALAMTAPAAHAQTVDDIEAVDYTDRNGETEFYVCVTNGHKNDRFVYNVLDARFCVNELDGRVEFMSGAEAGPIVSLSQIQCYNRNVLCKAPGT